MTTQPSGSTPVPRIPSYGYSAPTEADSVAALHRVWGAERGTEAWRAACRDAGLRPGGVDTLPRLEQVARSLAAQGGATATVARSIEIRIRTYSRLAARVAATGGSAR